MCDFKKVMRHDWNCNNVDTYDIGHTEQRNKYRKQQKRRARRVLKQNLRKELDFQKIKKSILYQVIINLKERNDMTRRTFFKIIPTILIGAKAAIARPPLFYNF